jgi:serine/threonine-protein kinase HipA
MNETALNRKAIVYYKKEKAGIIEEVGNKYRFTYDTNFVQKKIPVSISLPVSTTPYESEKLFPFFMGLLPEGWYLELVSSKLKISKNDSFGILLATCKDTIGAVSIEELK